MNNFFLKLVPFVFIILICSIVPGILMADFDAGIKAYQDGDKNTAFNEYRTAADKKDQRAYGKLAGMYFYGLGTKKDYQQAYIWFHMAYLTGNKEAERFRDAASATMTREEYFTAVAAAEQQRIKQELGKTPPQHMPPGMQQKVQQKVK